jgi:hypothetical protein
VVLASGSFWVEIIFQERNFWARTLANPIIRILRSYVISIELNREYVAIKLHRSIVGLFL